MEKIYHAVLPSRHGNGYASIAKTLYVLPFMHYELLAKM